MPTTNLGRVAIVPQGAYNPATTYKKLDLVTGAGGTYLYVNATPSTGKALSDTDYWLKITGTGIDSIALTDGDHSPGTTDTYTITYTDGNTTTFTVYNGYDTTVPLANSLLWRKTDSGNPVSVYPVPESPLYPKVSGMFTQEGMGDPSPENIRQITPWLASGASVSVAITGGDSIALTAPQEIPAGWMDNEGRGQVTWGKYAYTGLEGITYEPSFVNATIVRFNLYGAAVYPFLASPPCSHFKTGGTAGEEYVIRHGINAFLILFIAKSRITGWDDEWTGLQKINAFRAYLADQYAAGTPVTVVYQLATPIPLTPTIAPLIAIPQLDRITPRQNVLTASTGNVELTYAKSPIQESNEQNAAIVAAT